MIADIRTDIRYDTTGFNVLSDLIKFFPFSKIKIQNNIVRRKVSWEKR